MRHGTAFQFQRIVNTFTGSDGGASFVSLKSFVEELDNRASNGDTQADEILDVTIGRMFRLIALAEKEIGLSL